RSRSGGADHAGPQRSRCRLPCCGRRRPWCRGQQQLHSRPQFLGQRLGYEWPRLGRNQVSQPAALRFGPSGHTGDRLMKPIEASTCVDAWLQGCDYLLTQEQDDWRAYNIVSEIANPIALPPGERAVVDFLNRFLTERGGLPFNTVVNTIFPAQLYQRHGAAGVYDRYVLDVLKHVLDHPDCKWGTYAQRILCRKDRDGTEFSPLKELVAKLKCQLAICGTNRGTYELGLLDPVLDIPIYDPGSSDRSRPNGGPCLSHISVKLT